MNLKQQMEIDVQTFINPDEFGELHTWGKRGSVLMVVQDDLNNGTPVAFDEGVSLYRKICHVAPEALGEIPREGQVVEFDGKQHFIVSVENARGILKIALEANV